MGRVKIGEHLWVNLSRRSLCDNCSAEYCFYNHGGRVDRCDHFLPKIVAFKRCERCGEVFEISSNFHALDYDLCPRCNLEQMIVVHP